MRYSSVVQSKMQKKIISLGFSDGDKISAEISRRLGSPNLADNLSGAALYMQSAMPDTRSLFQCRMSLKWGSISSGK